MLYSSYPSWIEQKVTPWWFLDSPLLSPLDSNAYPLSPPRNDDVYPVSCPPERSLFIMHPVQELPNRAGSWLVNLNFPGSDNYNLYESRLRIFTEKIENHISSSYSNLSQLAPVILTQLRGALSERRAFFAWSVSDIFGSPLGTQYSILWRSECLKGIIDSKRWCLAHQIALDRLDLFLHDLGPADAPNPLANKMVWQIRSVVEASFEGQAKQPLDQHKVVDIPYPWWE